MRLLWIGRCGFGFVWRGREHQFYRNVDGSMDSYWTHHSFTEAVAWRALFKEECAERKLLEAAVVDLLNAVNHEEPMDVPGGILAAYDRNRHLRTEIPGGMEW